ncbi:hypothetical protein NDU88_001594 [Pleurodeles waltl]|uniref:Uncharacterized protein n=1 Tax=Pleurodeles waltl TaxID=8319 RepID=A0AAV7P4N4_PLEWA|nr:hypothetical protein NDU88_001594 [Pleurodeles waltl]
MLAPVLQSRLGLVLFWPGPVVTGELAQKLTSSCPSEWQIYGVGGAHRKWKETDREARRLELRRLQFVKAHTPRLASKIEGMRDDLRSWVEQEARAKQGKLNEMGEKVGKLLTWLVKKEEWQRWISSLDVQSGEQQETPVEVAQALATYLTSLYQAQRGTDQVDLEKFAGIYQCLNSRKERFDPWKRT